MNANRKRCQQQQKVIRSRCAEQNALTFFNLLTGSEIFGVIESLLPDHRERLFPPTETLSMFLAQVMNADGSCQNIVNQAATHRAVHGLTSCSTSTSGYCRARNRLPTDMVSALVRFTGDLLAGRAPEAWRWKGRAVRLVDGTTVTLPDTPANQAKYPQQRSQAEGLGFPICRVVGITCLSTGCLLDAAIGPYRGKGASEHSLLRQIMPTLKSDDILVGDGFYSSFFSYRTVLVAGY